MSWRGSGLRAWLFQRLSALYLAGFLIYLLVAWLICTPSNYIEWRAWMGAPIMGLATTLFFISLLVHAWVGVRDVVFDYVKPFAVRFVLLVALGSGLLSIGIWAVKVLLMGSL